MKRILILLGVLLLPAGAWAAFQGLETYQDEPGNKRQGPEQPIAFWHSVHAGQNQIPCMYCHYSAERSEGAGLPSVQLCVGCHAPGSGALPPEQAQLGFPQATRNKFWNAEATKLVDYWRRGEPIPWVKVHDLPEHVQFPHQSHVRVGLQCSTCHGQVQNMELVYQASSLRMGWCISCHTGEMKLSPQEQASVEQRSSYIQSVRALAAAGNDVRGKETRWPHQRASIDCTVCHY
jgi:hypothetical protein